MLSIGEFARRSRLSPKALRLYDRLGLLAPAVVDAHNRYRRYRESQLPTARLIVLMRRASIPLALVGEILAAPDPVAADLLASYWERAEQQFATQRDLVIRLRASLMSGTGAGAPHAAFVVRQRAVPEQFVITEKRNLRLTDLKRWLPDVLCRLADTAGRHSGLTGNTFVVYHGEVNEDSDGPVEACAPVKPGNHTRREAAHREAYTGITRAQLEFPQILSAYDAVADWIVAAGMTVAGPPREVYPLGVDIASAAPEDIVCDITYPCRNSAPSPDPRAGPAGSAASRAVRG